MAMIPPERPSRPRPTPDSLAAYVALCLVPGIGPVRLATLLSACETPLGVLRAPVALLTSLPGISRAASFAIRRADPEEGLRVLEAVDRWGGELLVPGDRSFPTALTTIPHPPTLLFALGDVNMLPLSAVAIVGSRDHTAYGAEVARATATGAARAGLVVVSGMARGIDAVAHGAALDAGGGTIGVLGNGFGVIYPAANRNLYDRMASDGLLLTEHPPGERPHAGTFPRRNRLISGLSAVTIVVEAASGSGALITVDAALNQGREVMAVPGPITHKSSIGTNRLLRDGATPLLEIADLLAFYPDPSRPEPGNRLEIASPAKSTASLAEEDRRIVDALGESPMLPDLLAKSVDLPMERLLPRLGLLELEGFVRQVSGTRYARA